MADYKDRMKDYVEVNQRIIAFYERYPEGSLQSEIVEHIPGKWVERTFHDKDDRPYQAAVRSDGLITVKAYAYRTPDDPRPGVGHSWLEIPGTTPYTETSELENAETSAWGRALASLGFEVKRSIASANEIRNKQVQRSTETTRQAAQPSDPNLASEEHRKALWKAVKARFNGDEHLAKSWLEIQLTELDCTRVTMTKAQLEMLVRRVAVWQPTPINEPKPDEKMADKDIEW